MKPTKANISQTSLIREKIQPLSSLIPDLAQNPNAVNWVGSIYDAAGIPLSQVNIIIKCIKPRNYKCRRSALTDELGCFEFLGLTTGQHFSINLEFPSPYSKLNNWDEVHLSEPGHLEKDIFLTGGVIHGLVIDCATGGAVHYSRHSYVTVRDGQDPPGEHRAHIDEDGRFSLWGLPAGTYTLTASGPTFVTTTITDISVEEGKVISDVRIETPPGGSFYHKIKFLEYTLTLWRYDDPEPYYSQAIIPDPLADFTGKVFITIPTGWWTAKVESPILGVLKRRFELRSGSQYSLEFSEKDFTEREGITTVTGQLRHLDGRLTNRFSSRVLFNGKERHDGVEFTRSIPQKTHTKNNFDIKGLTPGRWIASASYYSSPDFYGIYSSPGFYRIHFPDILVPENPPETIHHDLVIPDGKIQFRLMDAGSGEPIDKNRVWVEVRDVQTDRPALLYSEQAYSAIKLEGAPAGILKLSVHAVPYLYHETGPFSLRAGESLGLGDLLLKPSGIVVFNVKDPDGKTVNKADQLELLCTFPGREGLFTPKFFDMNGQACLSVPTMDPVWVRFGGERFETEEFFLTALPGERRVLHLTLREKENRSDQSHGTFHFRF